jgi:hypothetical protein
MTVALRTVLIWHDEIMEERVFLRPSSITLGTSGHTTFVVPELGLPPAFAIVEPGPLGYVLNLGEHMRGTICIDGNEQDVADLLRERDGDTEGSAFQATPIGGRDWGVIDLDASGHHKLFFQFVVPEHSPRLVTGPVVLAGAAGYAISCLALSWLWSSTSSGLAEAIFRGVGLSTLAMLLGGLAWTLLRQNTESQASLAFSMVLHAALLFLTYQLYEDDDPFAWPDARSLARDYRAVRIDDDPPEPGPAPTVDGAPPPQAAASSAPPRDTTASTTSARDDSADRPPVRGAPPRVQFLDPSNRRPLEAIVARDPSASLGRFNRLQRSPLTPVALTFGPDSGPGPRPGGLEPGGFVPTSGPLNTGPDRTAPGTCKGPGCIIGPIRQPVILVMPGPNDGEFDALTRNEIDQVVRSASGRLRVCYQRELDHTPGIGGKLVIRFKIGGDGLVEPGDTRTTSDSTLHNDAVEQCVKSNINRLKFPAKGGVAKVTYPFVFAQGG